MVRKNECSPFTAGAIFPIGTNGRRVYYHGGRHTATASSQLRVVIQSKSLECVDCETDKSMSILKGLSRRTVGSLRDADRIGKRKHNANPKRSLWLVTFKRVTAAIMSFLAVYFAVGSYFYGTWWYGFLWRGKVLNRDYITNGIFFLLDREIIPVIIVLLFLGLLAVYTAIRRSLVLGLLDRLWGSPTGLNHETKPKAKS